MTENTFTHKATIYPGEFLYLDGIVIVTDADELAGAVGHQVVVDGEAVTIGERVGLTSKGNGAIHTVTIDPAGEWARKVNWLLDQPVNEARRQRLTRAGATTAEAAATTLRDYDTTLEAVRRDDDPARVARRHGAAVGVDGEIWENA